MIWWEDFKVGDQAEIGRHTFNEEEIVAFGRQFDPQPFHVDDVAAARGPFGKLAASGWHTAAGWMNCFVASNDRAIAMLKEARRPVPVVGPGAGFTNLKWLKPVYPGDTVAYRSVVTGKRDLASRPQWGIVETLNEGFNQHGELVFSFEGKVLVKKL